MSIIVSRKIIIETEGSIITIGPDVENKHLQMTQEDPEGNAINPIVFDSFEHSDIVANAIFAARDQNTHLDSAIPTDSDSDSDSGERFVNAQEAITIEDLDQALADTTWAEEAKKLLHDHGFVHAVKAVRMATGLDLIEAKAIVESWQ